jgi:hypothetical protein
MAGAFLKIIGFWVDINGGTISLQPETVPDMVQKINVFLATPGRNPVLREWWKLAGRLNWLLNVLPWARPALSELYRKISDKKMANGNVYINSEVRRDLTWMAETIPLSTGIRFTDCGFWDDEEADMVFWTDACPMGALSYVMAGTGYVYRIRQPDSGPLVDILFLELMAIVSAIYHAATRPRPPARLLLWTDSMDAVEMFNSLRAREPVHNGPLLAVAQLVLQSGMDVRVRHIPGKVNTHADLLSRLLFDDFTRQFPAYRIGFFEPPRDLIPAQWRDRF